jgi:hypothetical protein
VRLHAARAGLAVASPVVEAQLLVVAAGVGDGRERLGVDGRPAARRGDRGLPKGVEPVSQPAGRVCWSLVSARSEVSSIPVTVPAAAARSPTATATASSSSSSSGGIAEPAPSR